MWIPRSPLAQQNVYERWHLDKPFIILLTLLVILALYTLYSASSGNWAIVMRQSFRLFLGLALGFIAAQIHPNTYKRLAPWIYGLGMCSLLAVLVLGDISKGAQRWLDIGLFRFQPSELMKLGVPLLCAAYLSTQSVPLTFKPIIVCLSLILAPAFCVLIQPDLGTGFLLLLSGLFVLFLGGLPWRWMGFGLVTLLGSLPLLWFNMHTYQKARVLTFLSPERDPLGTGYHIIQSTIAIGSGGLWGKGLLKGTQSQLHFLPERTTDFIFAVLSEESGFLGVLLLLSLYLGLIYRGFQRLTAIHNTFDRLFAGSVMLTFAVYIVINIGMVSGLLPVVGVPLPLVSYGGTALMTLMVSFGIFLSMQAQKRF